MTTDFITTTKRIGQRNHIILNQNEMKCAGIQYGDMVEIKFKKIGAANIDSTR